MVKERLRRNLKEYIVQKLTEGSFKVQNTKDM